MYYLSLFVIAPTLCQLLRTHPNLQLHTFYLEVVLKNVIFSEPFFLF